MNDIFLKKLKNDLEKKILSEKFFHMIQDFYLSYKKALKSQNSFQKIFLTFLKLIKKQIKNPYKFNHYHQKIRSPFDYYKFGTDFLKPLVDKKNSKLLGKENLSKIKKQLKKKENVILLSNHQSESDPQAIAILLEKDFSDIASKIIYVAGERVITDPLAIPFSIGCDLLCIYSKRYIDHPKEKKREKQLHNKKTMKIMMTLLKEGGKIIYVAPSGGRDRPNNGQIEIADFDPQSLEMFYLMAKKATTLTHFYPLSLYTYNLLPPPDTIQTEMGEKRITKWCKIHAFFQKEIFTKNFENSSLNKIEKRKKRAEYIHSIVKKGYDILGGF